MHFAITSERERLLLAADDEGDRDAVDELLEDIEELWDDDALKVDTDKAWDTIHRCLTDGTLEPEGGEYPLSYAILGGRHLHDEYYGAAGRPGAVLLVLVRPAVAGHARRSYRGGYAFCMSCRNWAGNQAPSAGAPGSAPVGVPLPGGGPT